MADAVKSKLVDADFSDIERRVLAHAMTEQPDWTPPIRPSYDGAGQTITGRRWSQPEFQDTSHYQK